MRYSGKPKMMSSIYLRKGALYTVLDDEIRKNEDGFLLAFYSNFTSIIHRFRDNDVFLQTGNDVMVIFLLWGAVYHFQWRILRGWSQVYIHAFATYFAYLQPPMSYSTFSFWLGFPFCRRNCGSFGENNPQKVEISKKNLLKGHFLESVCAFWAIVRGNRFTGIGCTRVKNYKNKNNKRHATRIFHHHVGAPPLIWSLLNLAGLVNGVTLSTLLNFKSNDS